MAGTRRRYYRVVISHEKRRWLPEVFVTSAVLRFSGSGRRALARAQDEARRLGHNYLGTEHLLLGILADGKGGGVGTLESCGISPAAVRQQVEEIIGTDHRIPAGHIPLTPRAQKTLELARREALRLGDRQVRAKHILLGLIAENEGVAAQVLVRLGADLTRVRQPVAGSALVYVDRRTWR